METDTPRTAAIFKDRPALWVNWRDDELSLLEQHARTLERDLIAANEDRERLRAAGLDESNRLLAANERIGQLEKERDQLRNDLNWQNRRNSKQPTHGGYEFYINEEWTGLADVALDTDVGWNAALRKRRIDPDDERVRVRRVIEDDALISERDESLALARELESDKRRLDWLEALFKQDGHLWPLVHIDTLPGQTQIGACNRYHGHEAGNVIAETLRAAIDAAIKERP